jgi:hypothetical protein
MSDDTIFIQFVNAESPSFGVIIEEENEVVYAYLLKSKEIVCDVWLYNTIDAPDYVDWSNPELMPFLAPKELSKEMHDLLIITNPENIVVIWGKESTGELNAMVYVENKLMAKLVDGHFPGYCVNAACSSRLAIML